QDRFYVFILTHLHSLAKDAVATHPNSTDLVIEHILSNLTDTYGDRAAIQTNTSPENWAFNNAGGAMGAMLIIHALITEYLIIFGTPLGMEGHTGRHTVDNYLHILEGEQWVFEAGELTKTVYTPGMVDHMSRGVVRQYKMHKGCWAMEYSRGWIPPMLPFALADSLTSTLDVSTLYNTVRITTREMIRNLVRGKI
ncbi:hypothetical protein M422DRAFT_196346, partial [Sphaerobolus stellatus SS14]